MQEILNKFGKYLKPIQTLWGYILVIIVLFLLLDFLAFGAFKIRDFLAGGYYNSLLARDVYKEKEWAQGFVKETTFIHSEYAPYVGYKLKGSFKGRYVNLNRDGLRVTDNSCAGKNDLKVFVFGGSTIFGTEARDNYTIPSFLSREICREGINVEVTNFGTSGYTNSQEMVKLIFELRNDNILDYTFFYDGINDVYAAYQFSVPGLPMNLKNRKMEFNLRNKFNINTSSSL